MRFANGSWWFLVLTVGILLVDLSSSSVPSFITPCARNSPSFNACVLKEGRKVLKQFASGIPELGMAPLDPLELGEFEMNLSGVRLKNKNAVMKGIKNAHLDEVFIETDKNRGSCTLSGNTTSTADYSINGKFLTFPLKGSGKSKLKMVNYKMRITWTYELKKGKDGKDHIVLKDSTTNQDMDNMIIRMDGLFGNDKVLGESMNRILNENWRLILKDIEGPSIKIMQKKMFEIFNQFYGQIPYEELFPLE